MRGIALRGFTQRVEIHHRQWIPLPFQYDYSSGLLRHAQADSFKNIFGQLHSSGRPLHILGRRSRFSGASAYTPLAEIHCRLGDGVGSLSPNTIKYLGLHRGYASALSSLLSSGTTMGALHILQIVLASTLLFVSVNGGCTNPQVRKEWRNLSSDERAAWINAVKVFYPLTRVI